MPRKQYPQPFWREARKAWFVQVGKRQVRLSPDEGEAWKLYHELMARPPESPQLSPLPTGLVVEIIDAFLGWCQDHKARRTYDSYRHLLQTFAETIPKTLAVADLKPYHVTRVVKPGWSENTKHDFVSACQRAFNWALRQGLIDRNPVVNAEKPGREARELAVSPADFEEVMAAATEPNFRELIRFAWESGVRPQEIVKIEARFVDAGRVVFPVQESKGKKSARVVYLTSEALTILNPLVEKNRTGPVFRNSEGAPWNKDSINCAFCRLQKKMGRKLHLGAFRKGYCTEALKNGVDTNTLAHLMGHANGVMISRVYARVQQDPVYMAKAANKAKGSPS